MTIFLIGYMAAGKTTLGRAFARSIGYQFIDLDFYIEQRYRRRIPEIFAECGEAEFRARESAMLREVGEFCNVVVSCGGGTPCTPGNMEFMNSAGITVWLDAGIDCICRRLLEARTRRPLIEGKSAEELPAFISSHLAERTPWYSQARLRLCADRLESRQQIDSTIAELKGLLPEL